MRDDKPWCGRPLPLDADGWKTRAFAFKDALLEARQELATTQATLAAALERAEAAEHEKVGLEGERDGAYELVIKYRDALGFYASSGTYSFPLSEYGWGRTKPIDDDRGRRARAALAAAPPAPTNSSAAQEGDR